VRPEDLDRFRNWFNQYTRTFFLDDREGQKNIDLKIEHTGHVCGIITRIAESQDLTLNESLIAETAALFHDIGRFPQYGKYKTFRDSISVNHGRLGADVLIHEQVLDDLPEDEQAGIVNAVRFHNALAVPDLEDPGHRQLLKMVRDADKLDIWRIFLGFYESDQADIASEAGMGLPDLPVYSDAVIRDIDQGHTASMKNLRTMNDFKLMLMSWAYDLNFNEALRLLDEQDYLNRMAAQLPRTETIDRVRASLLSYVHERLK
jgi:HD superfamily phosphohydrolase YqeK